MSVFILKGVTPDGLLREVDNEFYGSVEEARRSAAEKLPNAEYRKIERVDGDYVISDILTGKEELRVSVVELKPAKSKAERIVDEVRRVFHRQHITVNFARRPIPGTGKVAVATINIDGAGTLRLIEYEGELVDCQFDELMYTMKDFVIGAIQNDKNLYER